MMQEMKDEIENLKHQSNEMTEENYALHKEVNETRK